MNIATFSPSKDAITIICPYCKSENNSYTSPMHFEGHVNQTKITEVFKCMAKCMKTFVIKGELVFQYESLKIEGE